MVVLPDHLHCIWGLPQGDADFVTRWRLIKTWFTKHCDPALRTVPTALGQRNANRGYGNIAIGSTHCGTKLISLATSITYISTL